MPKDEKIDEYQEKPKPKFEDQYKVDDKKIDEKVEGDTFKPKLED